MVKHAALLLLTIGVLPPSLLVMAQAPRLLQLDPDTCTPDEPGAGYTTKKDCEVAQSARKNKLDKCKKTDNVDVDREEGRKVLKQAAGKEVLREALVESNSTDALNDKIAEDSGKVEPALIVKAVPLLIAFSMWIFWFVCLWTLCCKCCRCCKRERQTMGVMGKSFFLGGFVLLSVGVLLASFVAMAGHRHVEEGMNGLHCSSSTLLDVVLSGKEASSEGKDDSFAGVLGLLRQLDGILDKLADDSKFMRDLRQILTDTEPLERSIKMLTGTLTLLDETMALPDNMRPKSDSGKDLDHVCHFCQAVAGTVAPMSTEIEESTAKALEEARAEVKNQLTGKKLVSLREEINEAIQPLLNSKNSLRDSIGAFVDGDAADAIDGIIGLIGLVVLGLFGLFIPIFCCDGCAVFCAAFKARTNDDRYSNKPKYCACCGWCFGWILAFIGLLIGGILMTIMTPMSGVCLIMMDVNRENLNDWGPALGLAEDPKSFEDTVNIVDSCLGENGKGDIMDVIMIEDEGQRISLRQKLEDQTRGEINKKFDELTEKTKVQNSALDESEAFNDLLKFLETEVSKLTTYDPKRLENLQSKPEFAGFALAKDLSTTAFASSASCVDYTIDKSGALKDIELDGTIPGLNSVQKAAEDNGLTASASCKLNPNKCDCQFSGGQKALRDAVNSLMQVKKDLRQSNQYKCNLFEYQGRTCDPKDFKVTGNDCVGKDADGNLGMKTKEISCNYVEFVQYVKGYRKRIEIATKELEKQSAGIANTITTNLKTLVNTQLLDDMFEVVDNVNCRFIGDAYWGMVDGLCYQAARGISEMSTAFAVMGGLVLAMVILMYITFRRVADNRDVSANAVQPVAPKGPADPVIPLS